MSSMSQKTFRVNYSKSSLRNSNHLPRKARRESKELFPKFYETIIDVLITSFCQSVLPIFKSYVMIFQDYSLFISSVYYQLVNLVKKFYSCFVNPDAVANCNKYCFNKEVRAEMMYSNLPSATCMVNDKKHGV